VGNRQDNRSRGNAAQLLEKYKSLARDAQLQGDRVQSEYWLQFAEHYFRVLNETRARFEEQRPRRDDYGSDEDEDQDEGMSADGDDGDEDEGDRDDRGNREDRGNRDDRGYRTERAERNDRPERNERPERNDRPERNERPERIERAEQAERPRREFQPREERNGERRPEGLRPRRERPQPRVEAHNDSDERISLDVLPPAIAVIEGDAPAKAPRRRARRPREDGDATDIAPAA
jgi:hypothetical protein